MGVEAKLREWRALGLIDDASVAVILAHEESRHRPVVVFAVIGLGLLALALGIFSLVAANWEDVPAWLKLSGNVALMMIAAAAAVMAQRRSAIWLGETALFLLAALTLAGIALQSQIYQLTGALWQALAWWAVLLSPALLLLGRTRLTAYGYALMLAALAISYQTGNPTTVGNNLSIALPPALILAVLALGGARGEVMFRDGLFDFGLLATLIGGSAAQLGWVSRLSAHEAAAHLASMPLAIVTVAGAIALAFARRPRAEAGLISVVLMGSLAATVLALGVPHHDDVGARLVGFGGYLALWGGVAMSAARAGWHQLFRLAIAALALRLFIVYFELFYSLAFTGVGLVIGGLLLIGLAWAWMRIVRKEAL